MPWRSPTEDDTDDVPVTMNRFDAAIALLKPHWKGPAPLDSFREIDVVESSLGQHLPADFKAFHQFVSGGGEAVLPRGRLKLYRMADLQTRDRNRASCSYPVLALPLRVSPSTRSKCFRLRVSRSP